MGSDDTFAKTVQLQRDLANEFKSIKQFVNGSTVPSDNIELQKKVLNRAIEYAFQNDSVLRGLGELSDMKRSDGTAKVSIQITKENWHKLNELLLKVDESDIIQLCLQRYVEVVKVKRCLP